MSSLGKRIIVFTMMWVLLVMVMTQLYDNVTGRGMPARAQTTPTPADVASTNQDQDVSRLADLQSCVANDPNNVRCVTDLAALYYEAKQWSQAQVNYERAAQLTPHDVSILLKLAGTYIYQNEFNRAVATLQDAARLKADSPEIHLLLGLSLSKASPPREAEALNEWRAVIQLAPNTPWAAQAQQYIAGSGK